MMPIGPLLSAKVQNLFSPDLVPTVVDLLENYCADGIRASELERVRAAVLKCSEGSPDRLLLCLELARQDWRDVLVAAGFADDPRQHLAWLGSETIFAGRF